MKCVLFSKDEYFIQVFSKYIAVKQPRLELLCYTEEADVVKKLQQDKIPLILCEEGYLEEFQGKLVYIKLGMTTELPKETGSGSLNIYQKASKLLDDLEYIISSLSGVAEKKERKGTIAGFCSTEGGAGKTTIAYLTAVQSAKKRKTVYWNLEPLAVTGCLYQQEFKYSMEDILFARESAKGLQDMLYETVVQNQDGVYVLPNLQSLGNYLDLSADIVQEICEKMAQNGIEVLILDLPGGYNTALEEMVSFCNHVVWVYSGSNSGMQKEEKLKQDPYMKSVLNRSSFVRNRVEKKVSSDTMAYFPYSTTMQKASFISKVMEVNQEFVNGCQIIERNILR